MDKKPRKTKQQKINIARDIILVILGNVLIAFGNAIFYVNLNIVAGGLSGIGMIINYYLGDKLAIFGNQTIDIVVFILSWILWIVGFFAVSKKFALKTLVSTITYPIALAIFLRIPFFINLANQISYYGLEYPLPADTIVPLGNILLCGIFGGGLVGCGVALTFTGGASSGGTDVIMAILHKYLGLKESIGSFLTDAIIIAFGMFLIPNNLVPCLCGILSAFVAALGIELIYVKSQAFIQADIISEHNDEISRFAQDVLLRGATIISAKGGYKGDDRPVLRIIIKKRQYNKLKDYISSVDPNAFVTFTQTNAVLGEGFSSHKKARKSK